MATERAVVEEVLARLQAQAQCLWGKEDAARQEQALRQTAEEIATVCSWEVPPDLEPRFF